MKKPVITVVGSFAVGMFIRTTRMPIFGETLVGSDFQMGPGGKGSNQAVGVARLGARASLVDMIGADKLGEIAVTLYAAEDVDTTYLQKSDQMSTGVGFIILNEAGENGIILDMGANKLVDANFVDRAEEQIARSDVVMAVLEIPVEAAARAMELGRKHGVRTILNPAPAIRLEVNILKNVDYLTPNETELRILTGLTPDDPTPTVRLARQLQAQGAGTMIVTMGEKGALILADGDITEVPGVSVDVVDTTGAGDAFNAGLAIAVAEGRDIVAAVKLANCAGALACTKLGVIPALGQRREIEQLYASAYA